MLNFRDTYFSFTTELTKMLAAGSRHENVIFSPFSVIMLLATLADGTAGETREEILNIISAGREAPVFLKALKALQNDLTQDGTVTSANAVVVRNDLAGTIREGYERHLAACADGKLFASDDMVRAVNAWVQEKTRGMISEAADDSMKDMLLCMLNAVSFEALWRRQYEDDDIREEVFHNSDGTACWVQMLHSNEYDYIENDEFTGFSKHYKDTPFSYVALLPRDSRRPLDEMIPDFRQILQQRRKEEVAVGMPEFKASYTAELTQICQALGIKTVFTPQADFSPVSSFPLMADAIIHKARIEVDRQGTKAAAASMAVMVTGAFRVDIKEVILDRPFLYVIVHEGTGLPLFVGLVNQL